MSPENSTSTARTRVVVLVSGSGSNLQAIIDSASDASSYEIVGVLSNRPQAGGLARAENANIPTLCVDHKEYDSRETFDAALMAAIDTFTPDLVVLAGFMRILTPAFTEHYQGRMLNIHPSLLPKYPGLNTHQRALEAKDTWHGVTVHFVTAELDGGPPVLQAKVPVKAEDTADVLAKRVLEQEHKIYPLAVQWFAEERLVLADNAAYLDQQRLPESGFLFEG